ncbi:hypothetical protein SKAU_G00236040 [Synaphobranchus kaupii]|uniref:Uncharacterized protein n=1 Tax=Synaphobranchus kaupii TaxID=118154 RepID=A0A9Q1F6N5_SYNKA|nr:hypothetical protein SKAU_G00236040 [Synaphobranchus kaupii]
MHGAASIFKYLMDIVLRPVQWMALEKDNNTKVTRWFLSLQAFCFQVVHHPEAQHGNTDALTHQHLLRTSSTLDGKSGPSGDLGHGSLSCQCFWQGSGTLHEFVSCHELWPSDLDDRLEGVASGVPPNQNGYAVAGPGPPIGV